MRIVQGPQRKREFREGTCRKHVFRQGAAEKTRITFKDRKKGVFRKSTALKMNFVKVPWKNRHGKSTDFDIGFRKHEFHLKIELKKRSF